MPKLKLTHEDLVEAFRRWQFDHDTKPDTFLTAREAVEIPLEDLSEAQAATLLAYVPIRPRRLVERCGGCLLTEREAERFDRMVRRLARKKK